MAGQQFFDFCEFFKLCRYSFFYLLKFLLLQFQFQNFQNYLVIQLQFLFSGIDSAQVFCGRVQTNTSIHTNTHENTQHSPPHHTKHILLSSTDAGPLCSKWHEACTGTSGQLFLASCEYVRPTRTGPWPTHSGDQGMSEPCVQREPTGRAIIVIVIEIGY